MPYVAEISRTNPTALIFLLDQSSSMLESFGAQPDKRKADGVADALNRLIQNLVLKCAKAEGIREGGMEARLVKTECLYKPRPLCIPLYPLSDALRLNSPPSDSQWNLLDRRPAILWNGNFKTNSTHPGIRSTGDRLEKIMAPRMRHVVQ